MGRGYFETLRISSPNPQRKERERMLRNLAWLYWRFMGNLSADKERRIKRKIARLDEDLRYAQCETRINHGIALKYQEEGEEA